MSDLIEWDYLPAEINLESRYLATKAQHANASSVVEHWGIQSRQNKLKALLDDQRDNLHSLLFDNLCTCGLKISSGRALEISDLVISRHHRNPVTLKPEPDPVFRGIVGTRLFNLNVQNPIDAKWDEFVLNYLGNDLKGKIAIPVIWKIRREQPNQPWLPKMNKQN